MNNEDEVIYEWLWEYKYDDSNWGGSYSSGTKWKILSYSKYYTKEEIWDNKGKIYHPENNFRPIEKSKRIRSPEVIIEKSFSEKYNEEKEKDNLEKEKNKSMTLYTVIDNGIDGREKDVIIKSFYSKEERDRWINDSKKKNWYRKGEQIISAGSNSLKKYKNNKETYETYDDEKDIDNEDMDDLKVVTEKYKTMKESLKISEVEIKCLRTDKLTLRTELDNLNTEKERLEKYVKKMENKLKSYKEENINFGY